MATSSYIDIADIDVFPASQRNTASSRLLSEHHIVSLANRLLDVDGFVIDFDSNSNRFLINIKGYIFEFTYAPQTAYKIVAGIGFAGSSGDGYGEYLIGVDDSGSGKYNGLKIVSFINKTEWDGFVVTPTRNVYVKPNYEDNKTYYFIELGSHDGVSFTKVDDVAKINIAGHVQSINNTLATPENTAQIIIDCGTLGD